MRMLNLVLAAGMMVGGAAAIAWAQGQSAPAPGSAPAVELKVGDKAPNFKLQGSDGKTHSLSDFAGQKAVVIAWFPAAFTKGCTVECKSLAMNGDKIRQYDVAYFMASTDPIEKNTEFAKSEKADFPLLSDPSKEVAAAYGVLNERGTARRWTFYIGRDGRILEIDKAVRVETSAEDMVAKLGQHGVAKAKGN
jgi:peroxiredoxin Q/BCP